VDTLQKARALVDKLYPVVKIFKIGNQLFTKAGPEAVRMVRRKGAKVFLDLKFHDIPNTVANSIAQAGSMGAFITNIHASGGKEMMKAAVLARKKKKYPIILAVTVLTSLDKDNLKSVGVNSMPESQVRRLALLAKKAGVDGVVCSAHEINTIRKICGRGFIILTPGIRLAKGDTQDQKRPATAGFAAEQGADYIVTGRPVISSKNPFSAARAILAELR
jgi:orotidine-5'-phosphate decarboxylase